MFFLTWRNIQVRYKQTALGVTWAIIQPLFTMAVFSLFFGRLAKVPSDGIPYPIFAFAALVPWTFFSNGLSQSSNSLVGNSNLIKKVYFPRLTIPVSTVLSGVVDFMLAFVMVLGMMFYYRIVPTANVLWIPLLLLLALVTSLGVGLWLSALNVQYRDVQHAVPFLTQFWMFSTPIAYPSSLLSEPWRTIYATESDGRRGGRLPVGAPGNPTRSRSDPCRLVPGGGAGPRRRRVLFPPHGKDLCGRYLSLRAQPFQRINNHE